MSSRKKATSASSDGPRPKRTRRPTPKAAATAPADAAPMVDAPVVAAPAVVAPVVAAPPIAAPVIAVPPVEEASREIIVGQAATGGLGEVVGAQANVAGAPFALETQGNMFWGGFTPLESVNSALGWQIH